MSEGDAVDAFTVYGFGESVRVDGRGKLSIGPIHQTLHIGAAVVENPDNALQKDMRDAQITVTTEDGDHHHGTIDQYYQRAGIINWRFR